MADLEKVIDKIRKLFALGQSPNENEAAAAVAKAQELLAAYDLSMESIQDLKADKRTSVRHGDSIVATTEGKPDGWKADLFEAVAATSDCFTAYTYVREETKSGNYRTRKEGKLIGFGHDVEAASYALAFLLAEIERLAQAYADRLWAEIRDLERSQGITHQQAESLYTMRTGRHPLKAKLYFTCGAAESVMANLRRDKARRDREAQEQAAQAGCTALVLSKREAVEDFLSLERYGMTKAEHDAKVKAETDAWLARMEEQRAQQPPPPPETEAQRRKREAREAREHARWEESYWRKKEREEAKVDRVAYRAGEDTGRNIKIRPGVGAGVEPKKIGG